MTRKPKLKTVGQHAAVALGPREPPNGVIEKRSLDSHRNPNSNQTQTTFLRQSFSFLPSTLDRHVIDVLLSKIGPSSHVQGFAGLPLPCFLDCASCDELEESGFRTHALKEDSDFPRGSDSRPHPWDPKRYSSNAGFVFGSPGSDLACRRRMLDVELSRTVPKMKHNCQALNLKACCLGNAVAPLVRTLKNPLL